MTQNDTHATEPLSSRQLKVLELLVTGESITQAAAKAGSSRETVHRWLKTDYAFQAAFNGMRRELQESVSAQILATSRRAAETVDKAVADGDLRASLQVLRGTGMLSGDRTRVGSEDASHLRDDAEVAEEKDRVYRIMRRGRNGIDPVS